MFDIIIQIIYNTLWIIGQAICCWFIILQLIWKCFVVYVMIYVIVFIFNNIILFFVSVVIFPGLITMVASFTSNAFEVVSARNIR